jgi:hypothetical protein
MLDRINEMANVCGFLLRQGGAYQYMAALEGELGRLETFRTLLSS